MMPKLPEIQHARMRGWGYKGFIATLPNGDLVVVPWPVNEYPSLEYLAQGCNVTITFSIKATEYGI